MIITTIDRFYLKVRKEDRHWIWKNKSFSFRGDNLENTTAFRYCYRYFIGQIPDKHNIKNNCGVKNCVNPIHLLMESVTEKNRAISKRWEHIHNCNRCGSAFEIRNNRRLCIPCYRAKKKIWAEKHNKPYYQRTRAQRLRKYKEYRQKNRDMLSVKSKIYGLKNKEKLRKNSLNYYHRNKEMIRLVRLIS